MMSDKALGWKEIPNGKLIIHKLKKSPPLGSFLRYTEEDLPLL